MNGAEHAQQAEHLLGHLNEQIRMGDSEWAPVLAAQAQAHALLAQVQYLREIGDQFDTMHRREQVVHPEIVDEDEELHYAASALESIAIGDSSPAREMTVARLVLHQVMPYPDAEQIARKARDWVHNDNPRDIQMRVIADAIKVLKIKVDG